MNAAVQAAAREMEGEQARLPSWKLSYRIDEACAATGYGKSKLWALIRAKKIRAKKDGGITLIKRQDLEAYIDALPDRET